jgi:hypothetical protein
MEPHPETLIRTSRRALLAGGAAVLVAGCSLHDPLSSEKTPAARAVPELAPDVAIAVEAVTAIRAVASTLTELAGQRPGLSELSGLMKLHQAHLDVLNDAVPDRVDTSPTATPSPVKRPATLAFVRRTESELHDKLTALALRAESGPFARLLGAMAAAIAQQLVVGTR